MTLTYLQIYNKMTGQAWSMFDSEVQDKEEFETAVTTSIQKALSELWLCYDYPFRYKEVDYVTELGKNKIDMPNGNITQKIVNSETVYGIRIDKSFLEYDENIELREEKTGKPKYFKVKNDKIILYPTPDNEYTVNVEYLTITLGKDEDGNEIFKLENENDYIDIPQKFEDIFENALITKAMYYAIAEHTDENSSSYKEQADNAYKILVDYTRGIDRDKRVSW